MPEPTTATAASLAATLSAVTLALVGVDYYSLLYALVGAFFALGHAQMLGRGRAVIYVLLSTLAGAVIGSALSEYWSLRSRIYLIALCLVGGLVAQVLAGAILKAAPGIAAHVMRGFTYVADRWAKGGGK